jgi:hypothetical protein
MPLAMMCSSMRPKDVLAVSLEHFLDAARQLPLVVVPRLKVPDAFSDLAGLLCHSTTRGHDTVAPWRQRGDCQPMSPV